MITKEALIAEIEHIPPKDMETVYKLIQVFTLSAKDFETDGNTQPEGVSADKRFSFIGIGHSGKHNLSTQVEEILTQAANRREGWSVPE